MTQMIWGCLQNGTSEPSGSCLQRGGKVEHLLFACCLYSVTFRVEGLAGWASKLWGTGAWGLKSLAIQEGTVHLLQGVKALVANSCLDVQGGRGRWRDVQLSLDPGPQAFPFPLHEVKRTRLVFPHEYLLFCSETLLMPQCDSVLKNRPFLHLTPTLPSQCLVCKQTPCLEQT